MQHIQRCILTLFLGITLPLAPVPIVSSWAGPAEDELLRDAAGCRPPRLDIEGVKAALNSGADPNATYGDNTTPLGCVGYVLRSNFPNGDLNQRAVQIAKVLFAAGAKLGPADRGILFCPIYAGNLELVRLLIDKGASPTAKIGNFTPPEVARMYEQSAVYEYLISRGGIPVDSMSAAQMVLIEAARNRDIAAMERAINEGAFINGTDPDDNTALHEAVSQSIYVPNRTAAKSRAATIWWLLDHGADPNQGERVPPLHIFIMINHELPVGMSDPPDARPMAEETLARLLKAGAKVSGKDWQGRTPLHVAAESDNVWAAEFLIALGAKVMARDDAGKSPLDYAESGPMIKLLKDSGATER